MANTLGLMAGHTKGNTRTIKNMASESIIGLMRSAMKATGRTVSSMDKGRSLRLTGIVSREFGKMAHE